MKKRNSGITLVALVITIIVLIILAGVSINAVMNQGLITNAKDSSQQYEKSKTKEEINIGKLVQEVENAQGRWKEAPEAEDGTPQVTDGEVTLKVGAYVAYTPQSEITTYEVSNEYAAGLAEGSITYNRDTLNWRVLGVNEHGRLELISSDRTSEAVAFKGYQGYNNGVYLINDICNKFYGNPENGTSARGVNINDIQNAMNLEVWDYHNYSNYGNRFNVSNIKVPTMLALEKGQTVSEVDGSRYSESEQDELISQTEEEWEQNKNITVTNNHWALQYFSANNFKNEKYFELFINNGENDYHYLLASRRADFVKDEDKGSLGLGIVSMKVLGGVWLYDYFAEEAFGAGAGLRRS